MTLVMLNKAIQYHIGISKNLVTMNGAIKKLRALLTFAISNLFLKR